MDEELLDWLEFSLAFLGSALVALWEDREWW